MKTKQIIWVLVLSIFTVMPLLAKKNNSNRETVVFCIDDLDCQSCKTKIEKNIVFEHGVKALDIDMDERTVAVTFDKRRNNPEKLKEAFQKIGYNAVIPLKSECKSTCHDTKNSN